MKMISTSLQAPEVSWWSTPSTPCSFYGHKKSGESPKFWRNPTSPAQLFVHRVPMRQKVVMALKPSASKTCHLAGTSESLVKLGESPWILVVKPRGFNWPDAFFYIQNVGGLGCSCSEAPTKWWWISGRPQVQPSVPMRHPITFGESIHFLWGCTTIASTERWFTFLGCFFGS